MLAASWLISMFDSTQNRALPGFSFKPNKLKGVSLTFDEPSGIPSYQPLFLDLAPQLVACARLEGWIYLKSPVYP